MAADARGFPGGNNNINVAFIWRSNFHFAQYHRPPPPPSRHTIVAFLAPVLVDFVQLKFLGKDVSSFETHQKAIRASIACLLLYYFGYEAEHRLPAYAPMVRRSMVWFTSVSLASLASILVPDKARLALYLLCALFLASESAVLQMLWSWVRRRMIRGGLLPL